MRSLPRAPSVIANNFEEGSDGQTLRNDHRRRRTSWTGGWVSPRAFRPIIRDPRRKHTTRRLMACALGLPAGLHPRQVQRSAGDALPSAKPFVPDQGRGRRLHGGVRGAVRAPGAWRNQSRFRVARRGPVRSCFERRHVARGQRGDRDRGVPHAEDPRLRLAARSSDCPAAFDRVQEPLAIA